MLLLLVGYCSCTGPAIYPDDYFGTQEIHRLMYLKFFYESEYDQYSFGLLTVKYWI